MAFVTTMHMPKRLILVMPTSAIRPAGGAIHAPFISNELAPVFHFSGFSGYPRFHRKNINP